MFLILSIYCFLNLPHHYKGNCNCEDIDIKHRGHPIAVVGVTAADAHAIGGIAAFRVGADILWETSSGNSRHFAVYIITPFLK